MDFLIEIVVVFPAYDRLSLFDKAATREYSLCENNYMTKFYSD